MTIRKYTHIEPDQEVESIAGHYEVEKEIRLPVGEREALCVVGFAIWDKACCSRSGGCRYIMVPGYIVNEKTETDKDGRLVSEVEIINDKDEQKQIRELIRKSGEYVQIVDFW